MIRAVYRAADNSFSSPGPADYRALLQDPAGLLWVDLKAEPPEACEPILRDVFGFHPLAIDDALRESHVPKVDDWGDYLYLVIHAVVLHADNSDPIDTLELDIFFGPNYVVTYHKRPVQVVDRVWDLAGRDPRLLSHGPDHLLYRLLDDLVAAYMPLAEEMDEQIDRLEDEVLAAPTPANLERILAMKRGLHHLRRILGPQREVLNKLARGDYGVIDAEDRIFFRDVYDHLVRLFDINESMRDLVGDALSTYLSVVNNRMNDIMKTLTIITTLFMPISFVVGFFGMNFFQPMPERLLFWTTAPVFASTLLILIVVPIAMYLWVRRRGWM